MRKSMKLQILTAVVLIVVAVIDAVSIFVPLVALGALALVLFKPRWLLIYIQNLYGAGDQDDRV